MRSSHVWSILALAACSLFVTTAARAEAGVGFAVDAPAVSERGSEWFTNDSIDIRGPALPAVGVVGDWAHRPLVLHSSDGATHANVAKDVWTTNFGTSIVLAERIRASVLVPLQLHADGEAMHVDNATKAPPTSGTSLGDVRFAVDVRVLGEEHAKLRVAVGAAVWAPTGDAAAYATDTYVRAQPRVSAAGDYRRYSYAGSVGLGFRRVGETGNEHVGRELTFAASAGVRVLEHRLLIGPEVFGSTGTGGRGAPVEALLGAHYTVPSGFRFGIGAGGGLTDAGGNPDGRVLLSFEWAPTARSSYQPSAPPVEPVPGPVARR